MDSEELSAHTAEASSRRAFLRRAAGVAGIAGIGGLLALPGPPRRRVPIGRTPVRFWHMWTAEWQIVVERIADRFDRSQDRYEVVPLSLPAASGDSKFLLAAAGGHPPDLMAEWNLILPTWADNGLLYPLDTLMTPAERATFRNEVYPFVQRVGAFNGHLYAIGIGPNLQACYYRPDYFRAVGLDPDHFPETLESLTEVAQKLDRYDAKGNITRVGFLPEAFNHCAVLFGGGFYDVADRKVTLNTTANRRALEYLAGEHRRLGYDYMVRFRAGLAGDSGGGTDWPFISGAYAISMDGQWRIEQMAKFAPHLEYRTAILPPPQGGREKGAWATADMLLIPKESREPKGAWEFIKFWSGLVEPARAAEFYLWGGWLPITDAIAQAPIFQDYLRKYPALRTYMELLPSPNIEPPPPVRYQAFLADRLGRAQDQAIRGSLTPSAALEQLEADMATELARRKGMGYAE